MFKYETHLHTAETSKCGISTGAEFAQHYHALGYAGVFVTDHFLNGYTTVPKGLPWPERIAWFGRGYNAMAEAATPLGLDVFFAWEYSCGWAHYLTYGLGLDWLLDNPDVLDWEILDYFDRVHADGGSIVHAHPFREKVEIVQLIPDHVDAVEILNSGRPDVCNRHARDYAASFGLPGTAGSDIHATRQTRRCGVATARRLADGRDYIAAVKAGEARVFDENPD